MEKKNHAFIGTNAFDLLGDDDAGDDVIPKIALLKVDPVPEGSKPAKTEKKNLKESKTVAQQSKTVLESKTVAQQNTSNLKVNNTNMPQNQKTQNYNTRNNANYRNTNYGYNGKFVNNGTYKSQPTGTGQPRDYNNGGNYRRYQNYRPNGTNYNGTNNGTNYNGTNIVVKKKKSVASDETGSVKSERDQEEIRRKLQEEREQKFREFKYDPIEEKNKVEELYKLNKQIKEFDVVKHKSSNQAKKEGEIPENTDNNSSNVLDIKNKLFEQRAAIREYLNMAEQKKMTLADYEKILEEKKKSLNKQNSNFERQNIDLSGLVLISKKEEEDYFSDKPLSKPKKEVETEKPKKNVVPIQVVRIGGQTQNFENRNSQIRSGKKVEFELESESFPVLSSD